MARSARRGFGRRGDFEIESGMSKIWLAVTLAVVCILVLLMVRGLNAKTPESVCQASVLAGGATESRGWFCVKITSNIVPMQCDRNFLTVTDSTVVKNGKDATASYSKSCPAESPNACLAKNAVAEEMRACWHEFFEGKKVVFRTMEENWFKAKIKGSKDATACFVCSEITLNTDEDVAQLTEFLKAAQMPNNGGDYYSYIANPPICGEDYKSSGETCWQSYGRKNSIDQEKLTKGKTYAVTIVRQRLDVCKGNSDTKDPPTITVQVLPAESIKNYCTGVLT